jgi:LysM repeat protein
MNHDDDLERLISTSLAARSDAVEAATGSIDDVHRRVDLRRGRRRHVAAFGATTMLAVGAFALTTFGSSDPTIVPLAAPNSDIGSLPDMQEVWRCTGPVAPMDDQGASYFAHCEQTSIDGTVPTSMPLIPTTTIACPVVTSNDIAITSVPCTSGPPPIIGADCSTMSLLADVTVPCGTAPPAQEVVHLVEAGETLTSISEAYGVPIEEIVALNSWGKRNDVTLVEGETIVITLTPFPPATTMPTDLMPTTTSVSGHVPHEQEYIIQAGDSLGSIAAAFDVTLEQLVNYNQFDDGINHLLLPGESLLVPPGALAQP